MVGVKAGGYDDAIHGSADGQVTLCDLDATTRNIVTPDEVPDWDVGGAWCWTCLNRRPRQSGSLPDWVDRNRERSELARVRRERVELWWAEGLSHREIASRLGWSIGRLSSELARMRSLGYALERRA